MPFKAPDIPEQPDLVCIGRVASVGPTKLSPAGYVMTNVQIQAIQAGRSTKYNFMYRPDWLVENFDPNSLEKGPMFVFSKNVASDQTPALRAFVGSDESADERYLTLSDELISLADKSPDGVERLLADRFMKYSEGNASADPPEPGAIFGYVMQQKKDRDTGALTRFYDVGYFFPATKTDAERFAKKAAADPARYVMTFEV